MSSGSRVQPNTMGVAHFCCLPECPAPRPICIKLRAHETENTSAGPAFQGVLCGINTRTAAVKWLTLAVKWLTLAVKWRQLACWPAWCAALTRRGWRIIWVRFYKYGGCRPRLACRWAVIGG